MRHYESALALSAILLLTACSKPHACQVWIVLEESDTGTAQRVDVALEKALNADERFVSAEGPGPGTTTFVMKGARLTDRGREDITLTYEATDPNGDNATRRTLGCGVTGSDCMPTVLQDLWAQCAAGA